MAYGKKNQRRPMGYGQGLERRGGARTSPLSKVNRPHAMGNRMRNSRINPIRRPEGPNQPNVVHLPGGKGEVDIGGVVMPDSRRPGFGMGDRRPMMGNRRPMMGGRRPMPNSARRDNTRTNRSAVSFNRPKKPTY